MFGVLQSRRSACTVVCAEKMANCAGTYANVRESECGKYTVVACIPITDAGTHSTVYVLPGTGNAEIIRGSIVLTIKRIWESSPIKYCVAIVVKCSNES